jgi:NADH-quinone oxidoreductase subunit J
VIAQVDFSTTEFVGESLVAQNIAFGIIAAVMLYSAFRVVTTKNVVHAALYLVLVLAGVAANFILLGAEFLAITQVLVYIGAVIVLFLFGIMLTKAKLGEDDGVAGEKRVMASLVGVLLFAVMAGASLDSFGRKAQFVGDYANAQPTSTDALADSIFSDYIVPFEVVSVLLLAALIGAIVVARKD